MLSSPARCEDIVDGHVPPDVVPVRRAWAHRPISSIISHCGGAMCVCMVLLKDRPSASFVWDSISLARYQPWGLNCTYFLPFIAV